MVFYAISYIGRLFLPLRIPPISNLKFEIPISTPERAVKRNGNRLNRHCKVQKGTSTATETEEPRYSPVGKSILLAITVSEEPWWADELIFKFT